MRFERVWRTGAGPPFPASCATSLIGTPVVSSNAVLSTGADSRQCESRTASATDGQASPPSQIGPIAWWQPLRIAGAATIRIANGGDHVTAIRPRNCFKYICPQ